jgi:hypothetical protein
LIFVHTVLLPSNPVRFFVKEEDQETFLAKCINQ